MKIRYIAKTMPFIFTKNKLYEVIAVETRGYRLINNSGKEGLYVPDNFEIEKDTVTRNEEILLAEHQFIRVIYEDFIAYAGEGPKPVYDIRKISEYCKEKGISTEDLRDEEIKKFITGYYD